MASFWPASFPETAERALPGVLFQFFDPSGDYRVRKLWALRFDLRSFRLPPIDQYAFQMSNYNDGQDDALVFVRLELAPEAFGRLPDFVGEVVEFLLVEGESHENVLGLSGRSEMWSVCRIVDRSVSVLHHRTTSQSWGGRMRIHRQGVPGVGRR